MTREEYSENKKCATCENWSGNRQAFPSQRKVCYEDGNCKCYASNGLSSPGGYTCNRYERWSELKKL